MMLGNFDVKKMENRLGVDFPEPFRTEFSKCNQSSASNIEKGKWHCFDIPFTLVCGSKDLAEKVRDNLMPLSKQMKAQLNVVIGN